MVFSAPDLQKVLLSVERADPLCVKTFQRLATKSELSLGRQTPGGAKILNGLLL